jgi:hypothetical protein
MRGNTMFQINEEQNKKQKVTQEVDPHTVVGDPTEFMTSEDFAQQDDGSVVEESPNANVKQKINNEVEGSFDHSKIVEERLKTEADSANPKYGSTMDTPKNVLKNLINKGSHEEEVTLYGVKWRMRALDQSDELLAIDEIKDDFTTMAGRLTSVAFARVVYSIEAINGVQLSDIFTEIDKNSYESIIAYRYALKRQLKNYLESFSPDIINDLYEKYNEVIENRNKGLVALKNS